MNGCPPQPGLTDMHRTTSAAAPSSETATAGVPGLRAMPARQPASRIAPACGSCAASASKWNGDAVGARTRELVDVIRGALDHQVDVDRPSRIVHLVGDRGGDERPDGYRGHEVAVHHVHVDHPRARLHHLGDLGAELREVGREDRRRHRGAPRRARAAVAGALISGCSIEWPQCWQSMSSRGAHPDDRLVLAAVGALGDELVAPQAVDAPVATRKLGRPQPGLAASRAGGPA